MQSFSPKTLRSFIKHGLLCLTLISCQSESQKLESPTAPLETEASDTYSDIYRVSPNGVTVQRNQIPKDNSSEGYASEEYPNESYEDTESDQNQDADFVSILKSYQDLNTRLENVSAPLLLENAALCPKTRRDPGFSVHTIRDYPENLQAVARVLLPVSDTLSIRTVRKDGPADRAGLRSGDILYKIETSRLASGPTARDMYGWMSKSAFKKSNFELSLLREGEILSVQIQPQTLCDYPVSIFFSNQINGHSDGKAVWITSELMRSEDNDNNLALIIAHELAHNIHGNRKFKTQKSRELMADRMALVLMQRAGYDIARVISDWTQTRHPHMDLQDASKTHPTLEERLANFKQEAARIDQALKLNRPLTFR